MIVPGDVLRDRSPQFANRLTSDKLTRREFQRPKQTESKEGHQREASFAGDELLEENIETGAGHGTFAKAKSLQLWKTNQRLVIKIGLLIDLNK